MNPAIGLYRCGNWLHRRGWVRVALAITWANRLVFGTMIPSSAEIGPGFVCGYLGLGVVIHKNARIGKDCCIAQNVTIGRNIGDRAVPQLGDRVYVGAGAVIIGEISIGDDAVVGANSVVTKAVPARAVVAGAPAKVLRIRTPEEVARLPVRD